MLGYTLVKKEYLKNLEHKEAKYDYIRQTKYWFSGFGPLMKVLDYYTSNPDDYQPTIGQIRSEYAQAMGTDDYGVKIKKSRKSK